MSRIKTITLKQWLAEKERATAHRGGLLCMTRYYSRKTKLAATPASQSATAQMLNAIAKA